MGYALHPEVYDDLDEVHDYIGRYNPGAADRMLDEFLAAFDLLSASPHHGYCRPDLTSRPLRFKVVRDYLIAYLPELEPL